MTLQSLVETYGYAAVLAGTFLEGETVLLLAGFAAHRGYLDWPLVVLAAFAGSVAGDQVFYYLGRYYGNALLARFPSAAGRAAKVQGLLNRYHAPIIPALRFLYGLRTVGPAAIGMSRVAPLRFLLLNMLGAAAWAPAVAGAGYLFGNVLNALEGDIQRYEKLGFAAIVAFGLVLWLVVRWRNRKK